MDLQVVSTGEMIMIGWICFLAGAAIGKVIADCRWRANAKQVFRIYSGDRMYKVIDGEEYMHSYMPETLGEHWTDEPTPSNKTNKEDTE